MNALLLRRALAKKLPSGGESITACYIPLAYWEGMIARYKETLSKRELPLCGPQRNCETDAKQPDFARALSLLGLIDAALGRKEEAIQEGRRACELLPISRDAIDGTYLAINLAQIYALVGETDLAIEQINAIQRAPNMLSYGLLKLHPCWDSLRGDPRFEKIVASLAPK